MWRGEYQNSSSFPEMEGICRGIGANLRVTMSLNQGMRKYMEDVTQVHFEKSPDGDDILFGFFAVYDGHGGPEASQFAKKHLLQYLKDQPGFWSEDDEKIKASIKLAFTLTHDAMWKERGNWSKTSSGFPSTAGTTASVAIMKNSKIYIGHVGDSGIILGYKDPQTQKVHGKQLTKDHKPESPFEKKRIEDAGGCVMVKSGVNRVVWKRASVNHKGPIRRSTELVHVPFLAVARSLGDLWSYNSSTNEYSVSPEPDVDVVPFDHRVDYCLILGTDGLLNMFTSQDLAEMVHCVEKQTYETVVNSRNTTENFWINPACTLVNTAIDKWRKRSLRADNTSCVVVLIDPPGFSRQEYLKKERLKKQSMSSPVNTAPEPKSRAMSEKKYPSVTREPKSLAGPQSKSQYQKPFRIPDPMDGPYLRILTPSMYRKRAHDESPKERSANPKRIKLDFEEADGKKLTPSQPPVVKAPEGKGIKEHTQRQHGKFPKYLTPTKYRVGATDGGGDGDPEKQVAGFSREKSFQAKSFSNAHSTPENSVKDSVKLLPEEKAKVKRHIAQCSKITPDDSSADRESIAQSCSGKKERMHQSPQSTQNGVTTAHSENKPQGTKMVTRLSTKDATQEMGGISESTATPSNNFKNSKGEKSSINTPCNGGKENTPQSTSTLGKLTPEHHEPVCTRRSSRRSSEIVKSEELDSSKGDIGTEKDIKIAGSKRQVGEVLAYNCDMSEKRSRRDGSCKLTKEQANQHLYTSMKLRLRQKVQ
ncbi:protein phosphatase 1D [Lingula anatina]|uniref:Protein phosphatase 1D n=1 Tax=Lingula anatina TaxID=7574 RepID=A0A1S3JP51_LINAN|nr:protein phosphatase 1D [Lingula anatina]|eukprot:XP_013412127.1 protein phosphatase 1D [Lingula anatina]